ncbi:conserved hypothetical protein [Histoplasma capsulatum var. duboisii H88]|uniref:Uncharacterized protein n=1 Tax=Ajellomyces capsulatus (strain H88) TaxID=544711 RepID=F0U9N5_AJEC8|nr:conserved hypothetical protein [Histoplasma capsulatum var. duboisii H88]
MAGMINSTTRSLRSNTTMPPEELSSQELFNSIRRVILTTKDNVDLTFPNILPSSGLQLATSFSEDPDIERALPRISYNSVTRVLTARIMPTRIHDCHHDWLVKELYHMGTEGFLTAAEIDELKIQTGTTFRGFTAPYTHSSKEPDTYLLPDDKPLPTIVVETGWSESWPRLYADKDLWLMGGGGAVQLVMLIKWTKITGNRIKGDLQVHGRDPAGNVVLLQAESIFPAPAEGSSTQSVSITKRQLFGANTFSCRNPNDIYKLSIPNLRMKATGSIRAMGFIPA